MRDEDMKNPFRFFLPDTKKTGEHRVPPYTDYVLFIYFFSTFSTILLPSSKLISKK